MTKPIAKQPPTFIDRCRAYLSANEAMLARYQLRAKLVVHFPYRRRSPILSRIALRLLRIQGAILDIKFDDLIVKK